MPYSLSIQLLIANILFLFSTTLYAQNNELYSKINREDLKEYVEILSSDSLNGRSTGSIGQKKAAVFIAEKFKQLGLLPGHNNSFFDGFILEKRYWGEVYLKNGKKIFRNFEDMAFMGHNPENEEVEREIIFGGSGTDEELDQINVKGRLVLVFVGNLRSAYPIVKELKKREAYGIIMANPGNHKQFESIRRTYKDFVLKKRFLIPELLSIDTMTSINRYIVPNNEIKNIAGVSRGYLNKLIKQKKIEEFSPVKIKLKAERVSQEIEAQNVVGFIKGSSEKSIIISAHYDHLEQEGKIFYPGADDNASGTAALLELAEAFSYRKDLKYNIIFLATTAEEEGLLGSLSFANRKIMNPDEYLLNLNMDMISRSDHIKKKDKNYIYCIGTDIYPAFAPVLTHVDELFTSCYIDYSLNNSKAISSVYHRSDQYSFHRKGVPSLFFYAGTHNDYHKPTDTVDKIDFNLYEDRVKLIGSIIEVLATESVKVKRMDSIFR